MTLFRQINSRLFALFMVLMAVLFYFQFTQTRDFMRQQIESDLNNTMTSLGLMLQPHLETGDVVAAETLVNVIFEGGFYRRVTLTWLVDGKVQTWENPVDIIGVPQWFLNLELFASPKRENVITSGWMQLATLEIEGHPAHGYRELWRVMSNTAWVLAALFVLCVLLVKYRLQRILKPLYEIAEHAREIGQRKFGKDIDLPETTELRDVVGAINRMSGQLQSVLSNLNQEVSDLKHDKFIDHVSGLPNRQYLSAHINSWLAEPGYGGLILARFDWLEDIYSKFGYQGRDQVIRTLSESLEKELSGSSDVVVARIANTEFAFLLTKAEQQQIETYLQTLIRIVNQEIGKSGGIANHGFALGVSQRIPGMQVSDLLSQSDNALQQARQQKRLSHWIDADQPQKYSREQWRAKLLESINNNQFHFQWQPVKSMQEDDVTQREIYCRLNIDEQIVSAAEFMPFVELLSLGSELDKCLLTSIIEQDIPAKSEFPVAVNLTSDSIQDSQFLSWLKAFLSEPSRVQLIFFEIPESTVANAYEACSQLVEVVRGAGGKFGIDQCGRQIGSLDYLQELRPDYIKLDQSFVYLETQNHNNELCRALINVAKGLGIDVYITGIETEEQLEQGKVVKATGYQGYIHAPEDID